MMMMESGAGFANGQYQMSHSWRNSALIMPNHRPMVQKRANYLKRQFIKNKNFFEDYKKFMNEILEKEYARVALEVQPYSNT